jgi:hypothetical protein
LYNGKNISISCRKMTADKKSKASTKSKKKGGYGYGDDHNKDLVPPPGYENRPLPPRLADIGRIGNIVDELSPRARRALQQEFIAAAPQNNNNTNHIIPAPAPRPGPRVGPTGTPVQSPRQSPRAPPSQTGGKAKTKAKNNKKK